MTPTQKHPGKIDDSAWDVAVIGAGPAGGVAAAILSAAGKRVILIEKSNWPREKVCGGCVNAEAVQILNQVGLNSCLEIGQPIDRAVWRVGHKSIDIAAGGVAMLRSDFDAALVRGAKERGCTFVSRTTAKILPVDSLDYRCLRLQSGDQVRNIRAKVVLACDGIAGTCTDGEPWAAWQVHPRAWMGVSATYAGSEFECRAGAINMYIGHRGYVGAVRLPNGQLHLAAAVDPNACQQAGGPAEFIRRIFESCGQPVISELLSLRFRGIAGMTRRRRCIAGQRILAVGDACGYVEPFTGEGISWGVHDAVNAANLLIAEQHWHTGLPAKWNRIHDTIVGSRQRWCKALRLIVHHPSLASVSISAARIMPAMANFLSRQICRPEARSEALGAAG